MRAEIPLLQSVRVAAPCHASWDAMTEVEGDRVKFCSECQKRVYNLSAMGQAEAEGLLRRHEGNLCVRYYRRRDGTILTTDCPVGLKAARELAFRRAQASFALCALFCIALAAHRSGAPQPIKEVTAPEQVTGSVAMPDTIDWTTVEEKGDIAPVAPIEAKPVEVEEKPFEVEAEQPGPVMGSFGTDVKDLPELLDKTPSKPYGKTEELSIGTQEEIEGIRKASATPEHNSAQ